MSMNVTLSHTLMIPNGEVYQVTDSKGVVLWKKERKYIISFNANGGSGTMADQEFTFGELQALPKNAFSKSGNTFYGWSLTPDGMAQYIDGQSIIGIGNGIDTVVLYAVWTTSLNTTYTYTSNQTFVVPITGTYSIEMHGGGGGGGGGVYCRTYMGTGSPTACAYGGAGGGSGELYTATLTKGTSYALTIGKGGSGGNGAEDEANIAEATADNGQDGGTTKFGNLYSISGGKGGGGAHVYLYNNKEVDDGANGASVGSLASGKSGGATTGSYGDGGSGGSATYYSGAESGSTGQNGVIIIKLIGYSPYTVVFNSNGGTGTMPNQSFNVNETKTLSTNTLSKSGYIFLGWSTSVDGDVVYTDGESVTNITNSGETITLYAVWEIVIASGKTYTYTSDGTFTVPKTGTYTVQLHGGGGGGGGGVLVNGRLDYGDGGSGGSSGEIYTVTLQRNTQYQITIGSGGSAGSSSDFNDINDAQGQTAGSGGKGGTTQFGTLLSIQGGEGGKGGCYAKTIWQGQYEERHGENGASYGSIGAYNGYGAGGSGANSVWQGGSSPEYATRGSSGACIITYIGD